MKSTINVGLIAFAVSLGSLVGCGSSTASAPSSKEIKAAAGGTIVADGVTAVIPPGALAADTTITVQVSYGSGEPNADSIVAKVYDFGPNGTQFTQPVTLTMDLDAAKLPAGKTATMAFLEGGSWVALGDSVTAGTKVTATTTHFTKFTLVIFARHGRERIQWDLHRNWGTFPSRGRLHLSTHAHGGRWGAQ